MVLTFESGYRTTTTSKVSPADTQIFVKAQPAITKGRIYLSNAGQEERVSFDTVTTVGSAYRLNNCVRGLSRSADPATGGTGLTWIAGTVVKIVIMHDQPLDKQNDGTMTAKLDFGANQGRLKFPEYTTAQRDAIVDWEEGEVITNITTGTNQQYLGGGRTDFGNTGTPDATTAITGKARRSTRVQLGAQTEFGSDGSSLFINPVDTAKVSSGASDENKIPVLDATGKLASGFLPAVTSVSQDAVDINVVYGETISAKDPISILPDGTTTGRAYKYIGDGSITGVSSNQQIMVGNTVVNMFWTGAGLISITAGTISGNTISYGSANTFTPASWSSFRGTPSICAVSSTAFVLAYGYTWFGGGNSEWLYTVGYTISGTTITKGSDVNITRNTTQQTVRSICQVDTNKCAIICDPGGSPTIVGCTLSGTTVTAGTPVGGFAVTGQSTFVSTDKIAITDGSNIRLYTFSGTTPTQGNNLAIGTTYTSPTIKDIGSGYSIFTGTTGGNSQAFIVNNTGATPVKGTTVTYHTGATSVDGIVGGPSQVLLVSGSTRYANYVYSGTTLTLLNTYNKGATTQNNINYVVPFTYIVPGQIIRNYRYYAIGLAKESGVLNDTKKIVTNGGVLSLFTGLIPGVVYYVDSTGTVALTGDYVLGKAISDTQILVSIPHSTL